MRNAIVRHKGNLNFVPDEYMGDDPEAVKYGLQKAFLKHLREREFDHLLFAHSAPWIGGARLGLEKFLQCVGCQVSPLAFGGCPDR